MAPNLQRDTLHLPATMDFDTATFIEPTACCLRAVRRHGALAVGDAIMIVGLGGMGLVMVQLARALGAAVVLGSDFVQDRRDCAVALGASEAFDPATEDVPAEVRARTRGRGADVVIVCPADPAAIQAGIAAAAPGARVVCFTPQPPDLPLVLDQSSLYFREITLAQSYSCGPDETRDALRLLSEGQVAVAPLVSHRADLHGVADALERARGKGAGIKTIIYPGR
jgi:L-iditol 2-dehydrogenase